MDRASPAKAQVQSASKRKSTFGRIALRVALIVALVLVVAYFGVSAFVADRFTIPARVIPTHYPSDYGLAYEMVSFTSAVDNIPLTGWYINSPGEKVILLLHGRDATMDDESLRLMELMQALAQHSYDVFTFDFRAHGLSQGTRYSFGDLEQRDVAGALSYLKSRGVTEVGVISFSMGAVTALNAAPAHPEMRAIVADAAFADFGVLVSDVLPQVAGLPSFFTPGVFVMARVMYGMDMAGNKPTEALAHLGSRPVMLIHETGDPQISTTHHYLLEKAGQKNPSLESWLIQGADHGQSFRQNREEYLQRVFGFLDRNL